MLPDLPVAADLVLGKSFSDVAARHRGGPSAVSGLLSEFLNRILDLIGSNVLIPESLSGFVGPVFDVPIRNEDSWFAVADFRDWSVPVASGRRLLDQLANSFLNLLKMFRKKV